MLVLSRRQGQSVVIGDAIEVVIVQIQEDKVRIGVIAPPEIAVHRREAFPAIESPGDPPIEQPMEQFVGLNSTPQGDMLVLERKKNESIVINGNITVVVVAIADDKVRLGFDLPKEVPLHRRELYDALKRSEDKK